jgi:EpsI family protein
MTRFALWAPAAALLVGAAASVGVDRQQVLPLRQPLDATVPVLFEGYVGRDIEVSKAEQRVAGMSDYLMRYYSAPGKPEDEQYDYSIYVGFYETQRQGKTIHSPKNCLPGSGWEALQNTTEHVRLADGGSVPVNRYLLKRKSQSALVLYWYQGRGRVQANEYAVKLNLLADAAFRGRSDEALVRIVVPVMDSEEEAARLALRVAGQLIPAVGAALPE